MWSHLSAARRAMTTRRQRVFVIVVSWLFVFCCCCCFLTPHSRPRVDPVIPLMLSVPLRGRGGARHSRGSPEEEGARDATVSHEIAESASKTNTLVCIILHGHPPLFVNY
uniref:Uncharacterized protein n=1 Tax=Gasterosteus aculeatus TaxID=69293 RepID=G3PTF4_GASAC